MHLPLIRAVCQNALEHVSKCPLPDFPLVAEIVGPSHHEFGWHFDRRPVSEQSTADVPLSCFSCILLRLSRTTLPLLLLASLLLPLLALVCFSGPLLFLLAPL